MSVTHLHDWRFGRDGDVEAGIEGSRPGNLAPLRIFAPVGLALAVWGPWGLLRGTPGSR